MRSSTLLSRMIVGAVVAFWVAGCATDRLDAAAPSGVNLTGDWKLNLNLSDDPDKLGPDPDKTPQRAPGTHRGHGGGGRGGGGGMPPIGSPDGSGNYEFEPTALELGPAAGGDFQSATSGRSAPGGIVPAAGGSSAAAGDFMRVALSAPGIEESAPLPPAGTAPTTSSSSKSSSRGASINRLLRAPLSMSITQNQGNVTVKTNMPDGTQTADEYAAGTKTTIPYGQDQTAERTAGWRGPVFVVTTAAKKGRTREDDFAIDDDGRLIMTTQSKGGGLGRVEIKRVYDRIRGAQS
jgi:hypothetical protein